MGRKKKRKCSKQCETCSNIFSGTESVTQWKTCKNKAPFITKIRELEERIEYFQKELQSIRDETTNNTLHETENLLVDLGGEDWISQFLDHNDNPPKDLNINDTNTTNCHNTIEVNSCHDLFSNIHDFDDLEFTADIEELLLSSETPVEESEEGTTEPNRDFSPLKD